MNLFCNELILNHITAGESMPPFHKQFEEYKRVAYFFLNHKGKHLFADDILSHYSAEMTLEKLFEINPDRFLQGANREKDRVRQNTWYDIFDTEEIERQDDFFDYFFMCKIRHLSLLDIDGYLKFHLDYSFNNQEQEYFRFLQLSIRQYQEQLLNSQITETVSEWIGNRKSSVSSESLAGSQKEERLKGRMQREAGDKLTCLNQSQTVLLIEFMQKAGIILKDDNLTFTQAGKAFYILTGYSTHTIRQQLGTRGELSGVKFEDYRELHDTILRLASLIEAKVRKK